MGGEVVLEVAAYTDLPGPGNKSRMHGCKRGNRGDSLTGFVKTLLTSITKTKALEFGKHLQPQAHAPPFQSPGSDNARNNKTPIDPPNTKYQTPRHTYPLQSFERGTTLLRPRPIAHAPTAWQNLLTRCAWRCTGSLSPALLLQLANPLPVLRQTPGPREAMPVYEARRPVAKG